MTAKRIRITLMFLASTSSALAETQGSPVAGYTAAASQAAHAAKPAVQQRGRGFIKRRLMIVCHTDTEMSVISKSHYMKEVLL